MALSGILVSAGTATTNPAPNGMATKNPYPTPYVNRKTVSAAWTSQGKSALFPRDALNGSGEVPITLQFVPSDGAAVTYTVNIWVYNNLAGVWIQPKDNYQFNLTGYVNATFIERPGVDPIFIQLSSISSGTVAIYFDNGLAEAK